MFPKAIFNIVNSIIYTCLVYLIYLHGKLNRREKNSRNSYLILLIHLILWFIIPVFGQSFIWLIGSCNYLWTTVIVVYFLLLFRKNEKENKWYKIIIMFLIGILAGWTNENTSAGLIVILFSTLIIDKITTKKWNLTKTKVAGIVGSLIGFVLMICAPGNYVRNAAFKDDTFIIIKFIKRAIDITGNAEIYILPLIIAIIILISLKIYHKKKIEKEVTPFILGGFAATYSMVASPQFPERSWTGVIVYLIIALIILVYDFEKIHRIYKFILVDLCIILSIIFIGEYLNAARDINNLRNTWNEREKIIEKSNKNQIFKFYRYETTNNKNPSYGLSDIGNDYKVWPNSSIAKYYGIKGIKSKAY